MKVAVAFGTRPEAIKLAPVIKALRAVPGLECQVVLTGQHRELLDQALAVFGLRGDRDLGVMRPRQTLAELNSRLIAAMDEWLAASPPDVLIVQGDTTSTFVSALAGFYRGVPVAHVEAGLRTDNPLSPFPEEMNRRLVSQVATWHFAPTAQAHARLLAEGIEPSRVSVTGNTVVDALLAIRESDAFRQAPLPVDLRSGERLVLVTMHRRESWPDVTRVCAAIAKVVSTRPSTRVVFPVHPNPAVQEPVYRALGNIAQVTLLPPMDYVAFVKTMAASHFVMTDSGGVQEEAPAFGKPVLVLRENTERMEAVDAGVARLVGTSTNAIVNSMLTLLDDEAAWSEMSRAVSPFGDGHAADRIVSTMVNVSADRPAMARPTR